MSRMTVVTRGSEEIIEQITKQLNKLIDVIKLVDLSEDEHIEREMALVKVKAEGDAREEYKRLADIFNGRIIDVTETTYTIELTDSGDRIVEFITAINTDEIIETVRSGVSGIARGEKSLHP